MKNIHQGNTFESFLDEKGILSEAKAIAIKKVLAYCIADKMSKNNLTKKVMAEKMETSRAALDRLLDPENTSITLHTLIKAASVLDKQINITLR